MKSLTLSLVLALLSTAALANNLNQSGLGNVANQNNNSNSNSNHNSNHQSQGQHQSSYNRNSNDGNSQVTTFSDKRQAPAVSAPALSSGFDTCLGSASIGGSVAGFGITGGKTVVDENCIRLKNSERAYRLGFKKNALYLMCLNEEFRAGQKLESTPCPEVTEPEQTSKPKSDYEFNIRH